MHTHSRRTRLLQSQSFTLARTERKGKKKKQEEKKKKKQEEKKKKKQEEKKKIRNLNVKYNIIIKWIIL